MAYHGSFLLSDKSWRILRYSFDFYQPIDNTGFPTGVTSGGIINILVESTGNDDQLIELALAPNRPISGSFNLQEFEGKTLKKVEFKDAHIIYYKEIFEALSDATNAQVEFKLSCREITINGNQNARMVKKWPGSSDSSGGSASSSGGGASASSSGGVSSFNPND